MEKLAKKEFDKSVYNPVVFRSYKIVKKLIKYSFYVFLIYFAYEGFMQWD